MNKIIISEITNGFDMQTRISELWEKLKDVAEKEAITVIEKANRNEQFFLGDQGYTQHFISSQTSALGINQAYPITTTNYIRSVVNTYKARLTKDRPSVTAWPASKDVVAAAAARVSKALIEYAEKEMQFDKLLNETVQNAALAGTAGFKIFYDPDVGAVVWQPVTVFDYLIDPNYESYEQAKWVAFRQYMTEEDAQELLDAASSDEKASPEAYRPYAGGPMRDGVEVWELWHKPCAAVPEGLYCKIIGDTICDAIPYPYIVRNLETGREDSTLPIVLMKIDTRRGCAYGSTWLDDCIQPQIQVNELESVLFKIRRSTQAVRLVVPSIEMADQISAGNSILVNPGGANPPHWTPPPVINPILFQGQQQYREQIYDLAGLNEQLMGVSSFRSGTAAKQIAFLNELDNLKQKSAAENMNSMLIRGWKLHLQLVQAYYGPAQAISIAQATGPELVSFNGADIQGITVSLEPRAGMERYSATKAAQIESDAKEGLVDKDVVLHARETGNAVSDYDSITRKLVLSQIDSVLQGADLIPDDNVSANVAVETIAEVIDNLIANGGDTYQMEPLRELMRLYQAKVDEAQAPAAPPAAPALPTQPALPTIQNQI